MSWIFNRTLSFSKKNKGLKQDDSENIEMKEIKPTEDNPTKEFKTINLTILPRNITLTHDPLKLPTLGYILRWCQYIGYTFSQYVMVYVCDKNLKYKVEIGNGSDIYSTIQLEKINRTISEKSEKSEKTENNIFILIIEEGYSTKNAYKIDVIFLNNKTPRYFYSNDYCKIMDVFNELCISNDIEKIELWHINTLNIRKLLLFHINMNSWILEAKNNIANIECKYPIKKEYLSICERKRKKQLFVKTKIKRSPRLNFQDYLL